ncbi:AfsR/SARP family transcriptional regulator [Actinomycetospora termitidis]|uniref:Winged helix-turn-helix domain-containing protein n=1 Tax=Actinomycetospora termitidis TaxID=3053470 RepID=A0ABT7ME34_9PSEU|nr:winged helix-turn-helix domain-containing protein [Actinomycetospora sp. Odt1-22]MDL5158930.1 winged helix-turn-helix domain-containing protein [Actinomycetospora sp. Odt1-22]
MTRTRIRLLGEIAVIDGDVARPPHSRRLQTILALLAVRAGRIVPADDLIDEAWQDDLPRQPRAALHIGITRVRRWLGTSEVGAAPGGYRLDIDPLDVDLLAFLAATDDALETNDRDRRDAAVALWDEPVLPELHSPRLTEVRVLAEARRHALG